MKIHWPLTMICIFFSLSWKNACYIPFLFQGTTHAATPFAVRKVRTGLFITLIVVLSEINNI